jgi:hypothetical protein
VAGHTGKWVEDEDYKLKDAVPTHGDWDAISALVPGGEKSQCKRAGGKIPPIPVSP